MGQTAALIMDFQSYKANRAASAAEAQQAVEQAELSDIQTQQTVVDRGRLLAEQIASVNSQFSSSGVSLTGAGTSPMNFKRIEDKFAKEDIASAKVMGNANRRKFQLSAFSSRMGGKAAKSKFLGRTATRFTGDNPIQNEWKG